MWQFRTGLFIVRHSAGSRFLRACRWCRCIYKHCRRPLFSLQQKSVTDKQTSLTLPLYPDMQHGIAPFCECIDDSRVTCADQRRRIIQTGRRTLMTGRLSCRDAGSRLPSGRVLRNSSKFPVLGATKSPGRWTAGRRKESTCPFAHGNAVSPPASGVFLDIKHSR